MFHVKHFSKLSEYANINGIDLDEKEMEQFDEFCSMLIEKNKSMNLTAIDNPEDIETKHFIDSISAAPLLINLWESMCPGEGCSNYTELGFKLVDVGTGAGFPGIPLKIVFPKAEFLLIDSLEKRIAFVKDAINTLKLDRIDTVAGRVEEIAKPGNVSRETFDFCVTRAVANSAVLAEYCLPLVRTGGYCILYKSGEFEEELKKAENAIQILGGEIADVKELKLYGTDYSRSLIILRKIKAAPDKYPRRPGKPSKSPIK